MKYIITNSAKEINIELMRLSVLSNKSNGYFKVIEHPQTKETAFVFEDVKDSEGNVIGSQLDTEILVNPNSDTSRLIELTTAYTEEQKTELDTYIKTIPSIQEGKTPKGGCLLSRFPFRNLVEGYIDIKEHEYMDQEGWFD